MDVINDEETRAAVKVATDQIFAAIEGLVRAGVDRAEFEIGDHKMRLAIDGGSESVSLRFESFLKGSRVPWSEGDAKLPGMTPTPAPSPVPIDHFDLG